METKQYDKHTSYIVTGGQQACTFADIYNYEPLIFICHYNTEGNQLLSTV